jgi:selenide,water dikinase
MLTSNQRPAEVAAQHGVTAMTDVTGFGLAGHLREMLVASGVSAQLDLQQIPLLPGAEALLADGWESTLAPQNRDAEATIDVSEANRRSPLYAALFDPQTAGGLLLAMPVERCDELQQNWPGPYPLAWIGRVTPLEGDEPRIIIM